MHSLDVSTVFWRKHNAVLHLQTVGTVGTAHIEKKEVVGPAHQEEEKEQCKGQRTLS